MKNKEKISWEKPFGIASVIIVGLILLCDRISIIDGNRFIPFIFLLLIIDIFAWHSDIKKINSKLKKERVEKI